MVELDSHGCDAALGQIQLLPVVAGPGYDEGHGQRQLRIPGNVDKLRGGVVRGDLDPKVVLGHGRYVLSRLKRVQQLGEEGVEAQMYFKLDV